MYKGIYGYRVTQFSYKSRNQKVTQKVTQRFPKHWGWGSALLLLWHMFFQGLLDLNPSLPTSAMGGGRAGACNGARCVINWLRILEVNWDQNLETNGFESTKQRLFGTIWICLNQFNQDNILSHCGRPGHPLPRQLVPRIVAGQTHGASTKMPWADGREAVGISWGVPWGDVHALSCVIYMLQGEDVIRSEKSRKTSIWKSVGSKPHQPDKWGNARNMSHQIFHGHSAFQQTFTFE